MLKSDPIQELCKVLVEHIRSEPSAVTSEVISVLSSELESNPSFIDALQKDERVLQINLGDARGFQTLVEQGGIANVGNHYHLNSQELVQQLGVLLQKLAQQKPTGIPNNLPRNWSKVFVGREEKLQELHKQLQSKERIAITAVQGMGGIGKTELALQYAIAQFNQEQ